MICFKQQNAVSFWGLRPQAPNNSTLKANQKWKKTNKRWAKYCDLIINSRPLQRTSSLPLHSQRQCLIWIGQKQQKTSEKCSFASGGEAPDLQGLCHSAPVTNQKFRETNVNLREMLCLGYLLYVLWRQIRPDFVPIPLLKALPRNWSEASQN